MTSNTVTIPEDIALLVNQWIEGDIREADRDELRLLLRLGNVAELRERMAGPLEFGTAGLRGVLGAGPNRMNLAVVVRSTAGIAEYLLKNEPAVVSRGIVIGYDARRMGKEFAHAAAGVFAAYDIPVHLFPQSCPTPLVAYAITKLNAAAGIMVTASHNPPEYNGMKVYWGNGAQIIPPHDTGMAAAIDQVPQAKDCKRVALTSGEGMRLISYASSDLTDSYLHDVAKLSRNNAAKSDLAIVYTPLHGVGRDLALRALHRSGCSNIQVVQEQAEPDGEFPTVSSPNPEDSAALEQAVRLAHRCGADIIIANDPDADRLAISARDHRSGEFVHLTGNQIGVLFAQYLLENPEFRSNNSLYETTIVSSPMLKEMAARNSVMYEEVLPGFKWIANRAMDLLHERDAQFVFGYEEAIGYSIGLLVRDKDGISAAAIFGELAAFYKAQGLSVIQKLAQMYRTYGFYLSKQHSVSRPGLSGAEEISGMMQTLRASPPLHIGGIDVISFVDYKVSRRTHSQGTATQLSLPPSNVLGFDLADGSRIMARPSGTEPKIKFYFDVRETMHKDEAVSSAEKRAAERLALLQESFLGLIVTQ